MVLIILVSGICLVSCAVLFVMMVKLWVGEIGLRPRYLEETALEMKEKKAGINILEKGLLIVYKYLKKLRFEKIKI